MAYRNIITFFCTLLIGLFVGWWLGCSDHFEEVREEVRYVERPATKIDTELFPKWQDVGITDKLPRLQYTDTVREEVRIPADTAGIVADYFKRRQYDLDFSTDTTGVYKVQVVTTCNRLESASATIVPLQREVENTVVKVAKFRPYLGGSIGIGAKVGASLEVGAFIKEHHLPRIGYTRIGNDNYITAGYGYLF